jgi:hypothetical protein
MSGSIVAEHWVMLAITQPLEMGRLLREPWDVMAHASYAAAVTLLPTASRLEIAREAVAGAVALAALAWRWYAPFAHACCGLSVGLRQERIDN